MNRNITQGGFTLIELLVVISIIGLLASVVLASLNSARASARDAKRYSDLRSVEAALLMYYNDNKAYPSTGGSWWTVCTNGIDSTARGTSGSNGYIPGLAPGYISELPTEPSGCNGPGLVRGYIYKSDGSEYKFASDWQAETATHCKPGRRFADPARTTATNFQFCSVYSEGGASY